MNQMANMFKSFGIKKGDKVAIYMPSSLMAVVSMLACARIGAVHNIVFAGFSAESLASRINDGEYNFAKLDYKHNLFVLKLIAECVAVITMNQAVRGGKLINLKQTVNAAVDKCPGVKHTFVLKRTDNEFTTHSKDILVDKVLFLIILK